MWSNQSPPLIGLREFTVLEWLFCGAHYLNFIIHHFITIQIHKYWNHMLEICKEASNDCIWDDINNSDTYLGVLFVVFNLDISLDLLISDFVMLTCDPIVWKIILKTLNVFLVRLNISIAQILYYNKEYDLDRGLISSFQFPLKFVRQSWTKLSEIFQNMAKHSWSWQNKLTNHLH